MLGKDYCNLRGVVQDLVTKKSNFGSFQASKEALDKKYGKPYGPIYTNDNIHYDYHAKNGEQIAGINYERKIVKEDHIFILTDEHEGVKQITTENLIYSTNPNQDKFVRMNGYDAQTDCYYTILDSNNNGYVDEADTIELKHPEYSLGEVKQTKYTEIKKSIAEFLGL